jgi:2-amino-4-hydroxy-6-hydroxymethyldihydropteridine diphosphokinase
MNDGRIGYVGLGSNLGNRQAQIEEAIRGISHAGVEVLAISSLFETPPWGDIAQSHFLNAVIQVKTHLEPLALLELLLETERNMGRIRLQKWGPRLIDLDLLMLDGMVMDQPSLQLPHPYLEERLFVLLPLAELAPDMILPFSQIPILDRIAQFPVSEREEIQQLV